MLIAISIIVSAIILSFALDNAAAVIAKAIRITASVEIEPIVTAIDRLKQTLIKKIP